MSYKWCSKCGTNKPRTEFYRHGRAKGGVHSYCKECEKAAARQLNAAKPERLAVINRRAKLKATYGMTLEAYDALLEAQGGGCAICRVREPGGKGRFHVDHSHKTGEVRGLLCHLCNIGLGHFRDDVSTLTNAINYLKG